MKINNIVRIYFKLEFISVNKDHYYYYVLLKLFVYCYSNNIFCKLLKIKFSEVLTINIDKLIINIL